MLSYLRASVIFRNSFRQTSGWYLAQATTASFQTRSNLSCINNANIRRYKYSLANYSVVKYPTKRRIRRREEKDEYRIMEEEILIRKSRGGKKRKSNLIPVPLSLKGLRQLKRKSLIVCCLFYPPISTLQCRPLCVV
jgi:hypothetical protein